MSQPKVAYPCCGYKTLTEERSYEICEGGLLSMEDEIKCDNCNAIMKLRYSKDTEIIALGLTLNDYE